MKMEDRKLGGSGARAHPHPTFIPSPDAHILFLLIDWEKDASGRYEHKTLINLMKSSSPWLLPGDGGMESRRQSVAKELT